eukprot:16247680-Heterocapsa_arctica.AAC.1
MTQKVGDTSPQQKGWSKHRFWDLPKTSILGPPFPSAVKVTVTVIVIVIAVTMNAVTVTAVTAATAVTA